MIVELDFLDHWKTRLLVRLLGTETAPVHVLRLWAHCQARKTDRFTGWKPDVLASVCRWDGDAQIFWDSMTQTFCSIDGDALVAHDWSKVNKSLISAWNNGKTGGRPKGKKPKENPPVIPRETDRLTDREDREDREEKIPTHTQERAFALMERINLWFGRRSTTQWTEKENRALRKVLKLNTPPEDIDLLEKRYLAKAPFIRREIVTLLNNWNGEIDKARNPEQSQPYQPRLIGTSTPDDAAF